MVLILPGENSGTDPDFGAYTLSVGRLWMDTTEVSIEKWNDVALWASANGYNISTNKGAAKAAGHPVHSIYYIDSVLYCNARSEMEGRTPCYTLDGEVFKTYDFVNPFTVECDMQANGYRLPTNDEWEYAARGGLADKRFPWGDTITHANANYYAYYNSPLYPYDVTASPGDAGPHHSYWFIGDEAPYTAPVGDLPANGFGLHNMTGNVAEFTNPDGVLTKSSIQVFRGGCWQMEADKARIGDTSLTGVWISGADTRYGFRTVVSVP
jgi:formylglycine-generating enzyme required for sulfatase activity